MGIRGDRWPQKPAADRAKDHSGGIIKGMISINSLTKRFGDHVAVDNLSFDVKPGEVLGFLGPNGAGKSTTMKMLTGFLTPDGGSASVCGVGLRCQRTASVSGRVGQRGRRPPSRELVRRPRRTRQAARRRQHRARAPKTKQHLDAR